MDAEKSSCELKKNQDSEETSEVLTVPETEESATKEDVEKTTTEDSCEAGSKSLYTLEQMQTVF